MRTKKISFELEWYVVIAVALAALVIGTLSFMGLVAANADYICTHIIDETSECGNGSWGPWRQLSSSDDVNACVTTTVYQRTYTGTRVLRHILQYLNLRTACDGAYSQQVSGDSGGASGFHGGTIITEYSACQINETQSHRARLASGSCQPQLPLGTTTSEFSSFDTGTSQDSQDVGSKSELDAYRESMIKATITAVPPLVRNGEISAIRWQGREVTSCAVAGENGDGTGSNSTGTWTGTSGEQSTSAIRGRTLYTLRCTAFNGKEVIGTTTVQLIPAFKEE